MRPTHAHLNTHHQRVHTTQTSRKSRQFSTLSLSLRASVNDDTDNDNEFGFDEDEGTGKWAFLSTEDVESMDVQQVKEALNERGLSVCMHVCMSVCACVCVNASVCMCMCVSMWACVSAYVCVRV